MTRPSVACVDPPPRHSSEPHPSLRALPKYKACKAMMQQQLKAIKNVATMSMDLSVDMDSDTIEFEWGDDCDNEDKKEGEELWGEMQQLPSPSPLPQVSERDELLPFVGKDTAAQHRQKNSKLNRSSRRYCSVERTNGDSQRQDSGNIRHRSSSCENDPQRHISKNNLEENLLPSRPSEHDCNGNPPPVSRPQPQPFPHNQQQQFWAPPPPPLHRTLSSFLNPNPSRPLTLPSWRDYITIQSNDSQDAPSPRRVFHEPPSPDTVTAPSLPWQDCTTIQSNDSQDAPSSRRVFHDPPSPDTVTAPSLASMYDPIQSGPTSDTTGYCSSRSAQSSLAKRQPNVTKMQQYDAKGRCIHDPPSPDTVTAPSLASMYDPIQSGPTSDTTGYCSSRSAQSSLAKRQPNVTKMQQFDAKGRCIHDPPSPDTVTAPSLASMYDPIQSGPTSDTTGYCSSRSAQSSLAKRQPNVTKMQQYDAKGRCIYHSHIRLRKKKLFGKGWKVLISVCPDCCLNELRKEYETKTTENKSFSGRKASGYKGIEEPKESKNTDEDGKQLLDQGSATTTRSRRTANGGGRSVSVGSGKRRHRHLQRQSVDTSNNSNALPPARRSASLDNYTATPGHTNTSNRRLEMIPETPNSDSDPQVDVRPETIPSPERTKTPRSSRVGKALRLFRPDVDSTNSTDLDKESATTTRTANGGGRSVSVGSDKRRHRHLQRQSVDTNGSLIALPPARRSTSLDNFTATPGHTNTSNRRLKMIPETPNSDSDPQVDIRSETIPSPERTKTPRSSRVEKALRLYQESATTRRTDNGGGRSVSVGSDKRRHRQLQRRSVDTSNNSVPLPPARRSTSLDNFTAAPGHTNTINRRLKTTPEAPNSDPQADIRSETIRAKTPRSSHAERAWLELFHPDVDSTDITASLMGSSSPKTSKDDELAGGSGAKPPVRRSISRSRSVSGAKTKYITSQRSSSTCSARGSKKCSPTTTLFPPPPRSSKSLIKLSVKGENEQ